MSLADKTHEIKRKIDRREAKISVIGLGKMGLPIVVTFTHWGFSVSGFDIDEEIVDTLNRGIVKINEPGVKSRLKTAVEAKMFVAHKNLDDAVKEADFIVIIIPILLDAENHVNLNNLISLYRQLSKILKKGAIIIQESTLPPRTTKQILLPILQEAKLQDGIDFGLVFAPERIMSGRAIIDIEESYPKVVGSTTKVAGNLTRHLYEVFTKKGVTVVSDSTTAEAIKTFKGAFRDSNIALANLFSILADKFEIDILEVIEAANAGPACDILTPGIGVGGHCIPVYPHFLVQEGQKDGVPSNLLVESRMLNDEMVAYSIQKVEEQVDNWKKNILVLGLGYRDGIKEERFSPTLRLIPQLLKKNPTSIKLLDPLYSKKEINTVVFPKIGASWEDEKDELIKLADIIFITSDHRQFKTLLGRNLAKKIIFDGRFVLKQNPNSNFKLLQPGRLKFVA